MKYQHVPVTAFEFVNANKQQFDIAQKQGMKFRLEHTILVEVIEIFDPIETTNGKTIQEYGCRILDQDGNPVKVMLQVFVDESNIELTLGNFYTIKSVLVDWNRYQPRGRSSYHRRMSVIGREGTTKVQLWDPPAADVRPQADAPEADAADSSDNSSGQSMNSSSEDIALLEAKTEELRVKVKKANDEFRASIKLLKEKEMKKAAKKEKLEAEKLKIKKAEEEKLKEAQALAEKLRKKEEELVTLREELFQLKMAKAQEEEAKLLKKELAVAQEKAKVSDGGAQNAEESEGDAFMSAYNAKKREMEKELGRELEVEELLDIFHSIHVAMAQNQNLPKLEIDDANGLPTEGLESFRPEIVREKERPKPASRRSSKGKSKRKSVSSKRSSVSSSSKPTSRSKKFKFGMPVASDPFAAAKKDKRESSSETEKEE